MSEPEGEFYDEVLPLITDHILIRDPSTGEVLLNRRDPRPRDRTKDEQRDENERDS